MHYIRLSMRCLPESTQISIQRFWWVILFIICFRFLSYWAETVKDIGRADCCCAKHRDAQENTNQSQVEGNSNISSLGRVHRAVNLDEVHIYKFLSVTFCFINDLIFDYIFIREQNFYYLSIYEWLKVAGTISTFYKMI